MIARIMCFVLVSSITCVVHAQTVTQQDNYSIAASYHIHSAVLGESREIYISLPHGYQHNHHTYPVHILLDGKQNIEHAVATSRMLSQWAGLPQTIIVAIPSVNRTRDFTPSVDANNPTQSGGGKKFTHFIEQELMPWVDSQYRTHPFRVLTGHSLGGLYAVNEWLNHNRFFNAYIIVAPSLWWDNRLMFSLLDKAEKSSSDANTPLFLAIGELDGDGMKSDLKQFLNSAEQKLPAKYAYREYSGEGHMSAPMRGFYDGTQHAFADAIYDHSRWAEFTAEGFIDFTRDTKARFGSSVHQTAERYVALANYLLAKQDYQGAIKVLKSNIEAFPNYAVNHQLLANAYVFDGQQARAIAEYSHAANLARQSDSLDPSVAKQYEQEIARLTQAVTVSLGALSKLAGCYVSDTGSQFVFTLTNGHLFGQREGWDDFRLFAKDSNTFYTRLEPKFQYHFNASTVEVTAYGEVYVFDKVTCK